jgi:signal transduction histidine kinase/CheY-like chemotaxis protein
MAQQDPSLLEENLRNLREDSLTLIALFNGVVGVLWFFWVGWPGADHFTLISAWIGMILLLGSVIGSLVLQERDLSLAAHVLVWGFLASTVCAVLTFTDPGFIYLLILPILFASVLLRTSSLVLVALVTAGFTLVISLIRHGTVFSSPSPSPLIFLLRLFVQSLSGDVALPVVIIGFVAASTWLSTQTLQTTLRWVWSGYERARRNEEVARQRQAELARALKALDEATYRWKRANYMMTLARDQAEEARRVKQQFAQTISHELRTPLNLIVGFIEVMVQSPEYYGTPLPPSYMRDLSIVYRNACHLQSLVNDVLDLARIEAAQLGLVPEETDVAGLVRDVVNTARNLVEARGLDLQVEIAPELPHLFLDPTRIRQVLFNLLNNAARFTDEGHVRVRVWPRDEDVIFSVADTGRGIAPEDLERIFEEFQQVDGSTRRPREGAGLGLAISRRFVELHNGHIWVESVLGEGSTFYFSLPVEHEHLDITPESPMLVSETAPARPSDSLILAVTRSPSTATLLNRYIHGYRAAIVRDLANARRAMRQLMPQAVVIDTTSEAAAPEDLQELATQWGRPRVPFVACPFPGEEAMRQRLNVDGYLIKPITASNLEDMLNRLGTEIESLLIVDDDADFVRLVNRMLAVSLRQYQVSSAYSGQEALALLQSRQPDAVLLDLMLPDIPGAEVVTRIRELPGGEDLPIIIVSAQDEMDSPRLIEGTMLITKAEGLMPGEAVRWIQEVLDTATQAQKEPGEELEDLEAAP